MRPSGRNATPLTSQRVPSQGTDFVPGGCVPQLDGLIRANGGDGSPVRAMCHATDPRRVAA